MKVHFKVSTVRLKRFIDDNNKVIGSVTGDINEVYRYLKRLDLCISKSRIYRYKKDTEIFVPETGLNNLNVNISERKEFDELVSKRFDFHIKIERVEAEKKEVNKQFPNGFTSWQETHFQIVAQITLIGQSDTPCGIVPFIMDMQGTGGLYELAEDLTNEFENMYAGFEWDGEFFEEIDKFCDIKLSPETGKEYTPITK